jgi:hypothetical protein
VGDGNYDLVAWQPAVPAGAPTAESSAVVTDAEQDGSGSLDQHATQINVAALADAKQLLFASRGVLPWHDTNPSREVTPAAEGGSISDGGYGCGGDVAGDKSPLHYCATLPTNSLSLLLRDYYAALLRDYYAAHRRQWKAKRRRPKHLAAFSLNARVHSPT